LDKLGEVLNNSLAINIGLQGRKSSEFGLLYRWPEEGTPAPAFFETSLHADRIEYNGLLFSNLSMPISLREQLLQTQVQGRMNEGTVNIETTADFRVNPAVVRIPENSRIMTDVQLGEPLVDGVLRKIHPLFGILASPSGRLNTSMNSFAWPVSHRGAYDADFKVTFDVSRITLDGSGLLQEILSRFALADKKLNLRDTEISCSGKGGRISCTPVRILVADSEMILSGSVGMDSSLDYILEVPITRALVSSEVYQFLEGEVVSVPIRGTLDNPSFDKNLVIDTIRDLVKQAAVKVVEQQAEKLLPGLIDDAVRQPQKK
jgi:hypothetical protein